MFQVHLPEEYNSQTATAHTRSGKAVPGRWHLYPEQAAGGMWTTPSDLAKVIIEVSKSARGESNLILSKEMTGQLLTSQMGIGALPC